MNFNQHQKVTTLFPRDFHIEILIWNYEFQTIEKEVEYIDNKLFTKSNSRELINKNTVKLLKDISVQLLKNLEQIRLLMLKFQKNLSSLNECDHFFIQASKIILDKKNRIKAELERLKYNFDFYSKNNISIN